VDDQVVSRQASCTDLRWDSWLPPVGGWAGPPRWAAPHPTLYNPGCEAMGEDACPVFGWSIVVI